MFDRRVRSLGMIAVACVCGLLSCAKSDGPSGHPERVGRTSPALSTFVQSNYTNQTYVTLPYKSAQTAGNLNVVVVGWGATAASITSVTDSAGNAYTLAVGPLGVSDTDDGGQLAQSIYYAKNIVAAAANANVVTVAFSPVTSVFVDVRLLEYHGLNTTSPLDVTAQQTGTHNTTTNSGSVTTTNANDLLVAASTTEEPGSSAGTGFTRRGLTEFGDIAEDKSVSATGSYGATSPLSPAGAWVMQMAAFKMTSAGSAHFVQENDQVTESPQFAEAVPSVTTPYSSAQVAGDLNLVAIGWGDSNTTVSSVTDTAGNVYTLAVGPTSVPDPAHSGTDQQSLYYAKNIVASAANAVTVTFSSDTYIVDLRVAEYSGVDSTNPVDVTAHQTGSSTTPSSGAFTTTAANDLIVAAADVRNPSTPGSGFVSRSMTSLGNLVEDETAGAAGSYTATSTQSATGAWIMQAVALRASGRHQSLRRSDCTASDACHTAARATRAPACARTPSRPTGRPAATATRARRATPARAARARAQPRHVHGERLVPHGGHVQHEHGRVLEPGRDERDDVQRRERVHADRHVPERDVHGSEPRDVHRERLVPHGGHVQHEHGRVLEPRRGERHDVQRRQRVHAERQLPVGRLRACEPGDVHGERRVPHGRDVQLGDGAVLEPGRGNGTSCSDGNACTQTRHVPERDVHRGESGDLHGERPVPHGRHVQHEHGTCSNPVATNGTACNDGNACTQTDTCQSGTCTGANPVTCTASDPCHTAGTCNTSTGACSNPVAANGTACNDGNACTQTDACQSGTCTGIEPGHVHGERRVPHGRDVQHDDGCSNPAAASGTTCGDNSNSCVGASACNGSGACVQGPPPVIDTSNPCLVGSCDPVHGVAYAPVAAGTACGDNSNQCIGAALCDGHGTCARSQAPTIDTSNPCVIGTCDPVKGITYGPAAVGTACGDNSNRCAGAFTCDENDDCLQGPAPTATPPSRCYTASCDPQSGSRTPPSPVVTPRLCPPTIRSNSTPLSWESSRPRTGKPSGGTR